MVGGSGCRIQFVVTKQSRGTEDLFGNSASLFTDKKISHKAFFQRNLNYMACLYSTNHDKAFLNWPTV